MTTQALGGHRVADRTTRLRSRLWLSGSILAVASGLALGSILRLRASYGLGFDLGFYLQQIWLLHHGLPYGSLANLPVFADHLSPILYAFAPFGDAPWLAYLLVIVQALAVSLSLWPLLARDGLSRRSDCLAVGLFFVLSPALGYAVLFDFHPMLLGLPVLAWILLAIERRGNDLSVGLLVAITLVFREDIAVIAAAIVLLSLARHPGYRWAKVIALLNLVVAGGYVWFASAELGRFPGSPIHHRYAWVHGLLGGDLSALRSVMTDYILITVLVVYVPVFIFPGILRLPTTFLAMAISVFFFAADFVPADSIYYQYQAVPVLLIAWGLGTQAKQEESAPSLRFAIALAVVLAVLLGPLSIMPPPTPVQDRWVPRVISAQDRSVLAGVRELVPASASVSASNTLVAYLAQRQLIYDFPDPLSCEGKFTPSRGSTSYPEYVVVTDAEGRAADSTILITSGYTPVGRVGEATVFKATGNHPAPSHCESAAHDN